MSDRSIRKQLLASTIFCGVMASAAGAQVTTQPGTAPQDARDAGVTTAAAGPQAETTTGEIVVTGSLIRNPNLVSASPVNTLAEGELLLRSPNSVEEALRSLPGVTPGIGSQVNNGSNGTYSIDLRGLDVQRNLVLLDGNRVAPALANGVTDLNVIPIALLQRVDVQTGGGSATYGADAVSGVVNFITRRDFTGIDFRASYKVPQRGNGTSYRADLTMGANFAEDRGNAVLNLSYTKANPIYQTRPFALFAISPTTGRASGASTISSPTAVTFPSGNFLQIDPTGTAFVPQYQGFNFNPYNIFQTPLDRKSGYAAARYELADGVEVYSRGLFSQSIIQQIVAPSGIFQLPETINFNNPYLTPALRSQICTESNITAANCNATATPNFTLPSVYRRAIEAGPRTATYENNFYDARAGILIDLTSSIKLDLNGSYGRSEQTQTNGGYFLNSKVKQALLATSTTACVDPSNNCVPLNLFGPSGSITPAMLSFIQGGSTIRINTELKQARALVSGDFGYTVPMASKPISFALGGEYRDYTYERLPDAAAQSVGELGGAGAAVLPFSGSYSVREAFGEVIAPIVDGKPFFEELSLEGGLRYSSYKIVATGSPKFNTTTYKGGVNWEPVEGVRLRGNYQHAVRAPNIDELFRPVVTGLSSLANDPCAVTTPALLYNGGTYTPLGAVCLAQGAPANSVQTAKIPQPAANQPNQTGGGNLLLKPEKANTFTLGVVLTPSRFIPGFSLSVDYFNIKIRDAITSAQPGDVINACFNTVTASSAASAACTSIRRNPASGALSGAASTTPGLPLPLTNNGRYKTDGIDVTANYKRQIGEFGLNLNFVGNYTHSLEFQAASTSYNRNCVGYYSTNCGPANGQITPRFSFQQRTTVSFGPANVSLLWRFIDKVMYEGTAKDFLARGFTNTNHLLFNGVVTNSGVNSAIAGRSVNFNRIPTQHYFDLSTQVDASKMLQLTFTVQNLFDRDPPLTGASGAGSTAANGGNTFPSTYDTIGRTFSITARLKL